jgi:glycosyltransferase involved in cell wall biosynthesis
MRYAWDQFDAYFGPRKVGHLASAVLKPVMARLARWDRATSGRPDRYLAISQYVARRSALYYNRQSTIVFPPVDTDQFTPGDRAPETGFLIVSALVPYKRLELAIAAAHAARLPLDIIGDGPERARLEALTADAPGVRLLGRRSDAEVRDRYRTATAVLLPGEEDFGLVPVEAQACGRPVVALGRGGAAETVIHGETGLLVEDDSVASWAGALRHAASAPWDSARIRVNAERFGHERFRAEFRAVVDTVLAAPPDERW